MVAFYNAKDQAIYDAGDKFIPQTEYLQGDYIPTEGISYEGDGSPVSYAKSGIMTQAPIIYPPVNQGGGDGGVPYIIPKDDDDDDETYKGPSMSLKDTAKEVGKMFLMGPQMYLTNKLISKGYGAFKDYRNKNKQANAEIGADKGTGPGGSGSRRGDADISESSKDNYATDDTAGFFAKGGRAGYFFGGRVNYKAGGRTDAESQYGADSAGSYDSSQNKSGRQQSYGGDNTPVSNYDYSPLIKQYNEQPDYTLGEIELNKNLTNNTRLNSILNLQKTVEDEELTGRLELDNRLGKIDTKLTYGTDQEPKLSASYMNYSPTVGSIYANADSSDGLGLNYAYNNIGANANFNNRGEFERAGITYDNNGLALGLDTQTGASANFSRDILDGKGQIKAGGTYSPDGTYNATGEISFPFKNGGLAGLL